MRQVRGELLAAKKLGALRLIDARTDDGASLFNTAETLYCLRNFPRMASQSPHDCRRNAAGLPLQHGRDAASLTIGLEPPLACGPDRLHTAAFTATAEAPSLAYRRVQAALGGRRVRRRPRRRAHRRRRHPQAPECQPRRPSLGRRVARARARSKARGARPGRRRRRRRRPADWAHRHLDPRPPPRPLATRTLDGCRLALPRHASGEDL